MDVHFNRGKESFMNLQGLSRFTLALAGAALALAAIPAAIAQTYAQPSTRPYYDAERDVMVTPRQAAGSRFAQTYRIEAPVESSPGAVIPPGTSSSGSLHSSGQLVYGSSVPPSRRYDSAPAPISSSPGAVGASGSASVTAPSSPAAPAAGSYYDPVRDVMVTPSISGVVRGGVQSPPVVQGPATFEFVVRNGQLLEGPQQITVDHGSEVTLIVDSNTPDALRVDGYNLVAPVVAGQPLMLTFTAEQPGRFTYRLDSSGRALGVIEVGPARPGMTVGMR
jgi:hypothetical protein